jgi:hypothetical protein
MTRRSASAALKKLSEARFNLETGIGELSHELIRATDRAFVIVWCAVVEDNLRLWLVKNMRHLSSDDEDKLFSGYGPLSSFSARIGVAFAFSLIGEKTKYKLNIIREIRNSFAHTGAPLSFGTPEVINVCRLLDLSCLPDDPEQTDPRSTYQAVCFRTAGLLHNGCHGKEPSSLP